MPTAAQQLAQWLAARRAAGFPPAARAAATGLVLDWLGCALAGLATPVGGMFRHHARDHGGGAAVALGVGGRAPETAALHNAALSHIVEMDDVERTSVLHPGTVVIPAALALAQAQQASGRRLLDAIVAGYEVMVRVGSAVGARHYRYFHNTATCGPFGAAAAAGYLLDLDTEHLTWALGNAGTQAAGLWQFNLDGTLTKPLHAGRAAAAGVLAAQLAALGLSGPHAILEGPCGFFAALAPEGETERVTAGLDQAQTPLAVHTVSLKPHASCRHTHAAIDAALGLRPQLGGELPVAVTVETYQTALDVCHRPVPETTSQAKFSLEFCVAAALVRGQAGLAEFEGDGLADRDVRTLAARVVLRADAARTARYPAEWSAVVSVVRADGGVVSAQQRYPRGDPEAPLSLAEREAKFRLLAGHAGLAPEAAGRLLNWVLALDAEATPDFSVLDEVICITF